MMNTKLKFFGLTIVGFVFMLNSNFAQTKLSILYKKGDIKGSTSDYLKPNSIVKWSGKFSIDEFTISDSITYYETIENYDEKDEYVIKTIRKNRKNKTIGKTFVAGASYCNYARGISIDEIEWKDDNYLVKDTIQNKQKNWILGEERKIVLGYPCKQAYTMNGSETDMIVWYTENFKCSYSASGDTSLPGVILEIYNPKNGILTSAIDLQIETNPIMLPKGALILQEAFQKLKKNKKS